MLHIWRGMATEDGARKGYREREGRRAGLADSCGRALPFLQHSRERQREEGYYWSRVGEDREGESGAGGETGTGEQGSSGRERTHTHEWED